jgi:hypothetical protein
MRYVLLLAGMLFLGLGLSHCWNWCTGGVDYPTSICGTQRQMCVMIGGMLLVGCGLLAAGIGGWKQAKLEGLLLGLVGGPIGVVVAFFPDNRQKCPQCAGRLPARAGVCPHCQAEFRARHRDTKSDPQGVENRRSATEERNADWMARGKKKGE